MIEEVIGIIKAERETYLHAAQEAAKRHNSEAFDRMSEIAEALHDVLRKVVVLNGRDG